MNAPLRIATWNVERPTRFSHKVPAINAALKELAAEIVVLTETNTCIVPGDGYYVCSTLPLAPDKDGEYYKQGELRVSIYSVFPIIGQLPVSNPETTVCALIDTPYGQLAVYGCIIGIHGRGKGFDIDLKQQVEDLSQIAQLHPVCYTGDFNVSFCDSYYTKKEAKELLEKSFSTFGMKNLTADIPETIDHIVISESFLANASVQHSCWNEDKKLSDHKGVKVTLQR